MRRAERFDAIKSCESMAYAGKTATMECYTRFRTGDWRIPSSVSGFTIDDLLRCSQDLEKTYLIRIFAEFEITLRDYWEKGMERTRVTYPKAETLINRIASHCTVRTADLGNVHAVREYRNSLIHGGAVRSITPPEARKYLCMFLGNLPQVWP